MPGVGGRGAEVLAPPFSPRPFTGYRIRASRRRRRGRRIRGFTGRGPGPNFSKLFQGKSKLFQAFSKLFPSNSKHFPWRFPTKSTGWRRRRPISRFFEASAPEWPSRRDRARRTPPARALAEVSFLSRFPFFRKKMSRRRHGRLCAKPAGGRALSAQRRSRRGLGPVSPIGLPLGEAAPIRRRSLGCENSDRNGLSRARHSPSIDGRLSTLYRRAACGGRDP